MWILTVNACHYIDENSVIKIENGKIVSYSSSFSCDIITNAVSPAVLQNYLRQIQKSIVLGIKVVDFSLGTDYKNT